MLVDPTDELCLTRHPIKWPLNFRPGNGCSGERLSSASVPVLRSATKLPPPKSL
uniref:Uncharacterized protein n=1 Tax=Anguilla anguilla TaxID=7936 RepID=A0A0E9S356_ANGAN